MYYKRSSTPVSRQHNCQICAQSLPGHVSLIVLLFSSLSLMHNQLLFSSTIESVYSPLLDNCGYHISSSLLSLVHLCCYAIMATTSTLLFYYYIQARHIQFAHPFSTIVTSIATSSLLSLSKLSHQN